MKTPHPRGTLPAAALALAALLTGCQSAAPIGAETSWVPAAQPRFVTIGRSTTYALVHREEADLLIVEDPVLDHEGAPTGTRLTWLVNIPRTAPFDAPIAVGEPGGPGAWLVEEIEGRQTHAGPAFGAVFVHHRSASLLSATLHLQAPGAPPTAGMATRTTTDIDRRLDFALRAPFTAGYDEMRTRSGAARRARR